MEHHRLRPRPRVSPLGGIGLAALWPAGYAPATAATATAQGNGRYFDRTALDKLLADVQTQATSEPQPLGNARK